LYHIIKIQDDTTLLKENKGRGCKMVELLLPAFRNMHSIIK
jgi:hypothetical protein